MIQTQSTSVIEKMSKQMNQPKQERTQKRMEKVLNTTQEMLLNIGLEHISIPDIALASGVPRASIYQFFPTKYELMRHIALQHLQQLIEQLKRTALELILAYPDLNLTSYGRMITAKMIQITAAFYNQNPVASMLILNGSMTKDAYLQYQLELQKISAMLRDALKMIQVDDYIPSQPDTLTILIEAVLSAMKHGYYTENYISDAICQECYRIAMGYLQALMQQQFALDQAFTEPNTSI